MSLLTILGFFSGILIFIYGIINASRRLENIFSFQLRNYLNLASHSRARAVAGGFLFTLLTQSSSATSVIVITLVSSGLIVLPAALAMFLGAGVGATVTVQLIAFNIYDWAIVICGLGIIIRLVGRTNRTRSLGEGLFYFALIFLGMKIMSDSFSPLKSSPLTGEILEGFLGSPLSGFLIAAFFTALVQTSAATLGIVITLVVAGVMNIEIALYMALGANIGTCITAIISSMSGNAVSKQAAWGFLLMKILGAVMVFPFVLIIAGWLPLLSDSPARQVAHFHTFFNIFITLVFVPLSGFIASFLETLLPARIVSPDEFRPKYLDPNSLILPGMALANAHREVTRMAGIVESMLRDSLKAFESNDLELIEKTEKLEGEVDILNREIKLYLTKLSRTNLTSGQSHREMALLTFTVNLEHIADIIEASLMGMARKRLSMGVNFSKEGWTDITGLHRLVLANFNTALGAFVENNYALARQVLAQKNKVIDIERELRQAHVNRLHKGLTETLDTTSLHMDILRDLQLINSFISNIIFPIIEAGVSRSKRRE